MIGCNPNPTFREGWSSKSGRAFNVMDEPPYDKHSDWSIASNKYRIKRGTVGWMHLFNGADGHLVGLLIFSGKPRPEEETNRRTGEQFEITYGPGSLWRMPQEWWVPGRRIQAHPEWSDAAPYTSRRVKRFANGMALAESDAAVLRNFLHRDAQGWLRDAVERAERGKYPPEPP